ncbi:hypothetical protein N7481_003871 [Penicillium waksmanii]|uniref:uncharacterized protein n=1 Tax=Penicillium waksmanii TaxID=69791 RepID=UPI0025466BD5|nr:uncharacterized protein N7481_003871 [Penicillium waksmanii]KAJ5988661.1 hypothetical protein N7481_003871 [Penicillium waksmanii]
MDPHVLAPGRMHGTLVHSSRDDFQAHWEGKSLQDPLAFIRSLTSNALDLSHSCFSKAKKGQVTQRNEYPDEEEFLNDNSDPESSLVEFESLVEELERKSNELRLPLREFLAGYWYRHVKDHLLTPQDSEEQHITGARNIGIGLEFCGLSVPDWMEVLFARKVEEAEDEDLESVDID